MATTTPIDAQDERRRERRAIYGMSHPAAMGEVVKQGHADYCRDYGHATYTNDGVDQGWCPRCGATTTAPDAMPAESDAVSLLINADARGWYPATFTHRGRHFAMVPGGPSTHTADGVVLRVWNDRARMTDILVRPTDNVDVNGHYDPFGRIVAARPEHPYSPGDRVSYTPAGGSPLTGTIAHTERRSVTITPDGIGGMSHILYPANDAISILEGVSE